jgi:hypothetical protein
MHHYRDAHALFRSYLILAYRGDYRGIHAFDEHVDDARSKEEAACMSSSCECSDGRGYHRKVRITSQGHEK